MLGFKRAAALKESATNLALLQGEEVFHKAEGSLLEMNGKRDGGKALLTVTNKRVHIGHRPYGQVWSQTTVPMAQISGVTLTGSRLTIQHVGGNISFAMLRHPSQLQAVYQALEAARCA